MNIEYVLLLVGFLLMGFVTCLSVLVPQLKQTTRRLQAARSYIASLEAAQKAVANPAEESNFRYWAQVPATVSRFREEFDTWRFALDRFALDAPGLSSVGDVPFVGMHGMCVFLRNIKFLWKHFDEDFKATIRQYFNVNDDYDPPLVNV